MAKVYIINAGEDDSNWTVGAFSTMEKAQCYYDKFQGCDETYTLDEPSEFIVDDLENVQPVETFSACINLVTKEITKGETKKLIQIEPFKKYRYNPFADKDYYTDHQICTSTKSFEDAIEMARRNF